MDDCSLHCDERPVPDLSEPLPLYQPPRQERSKIIPPDVAAIKAVPSLGPRTNLQTLVYLLETVSLAHAHHRLALSLCSEITRLGQR